MCLLKIWLCSVVLGSAASSGYKPLIVPSFPLLCIELYNGEPGENAFYSHSLPSFLSPCVTLYQWNAGLYPMEYILYMLLKFWVSFPEFLAAQIQSLPRTIHREPASDVNFLCWQALVDMNLMLILRGSDFWLCIAYSWNDHTAWLCFMEEGKFLYPNSHSYTFSALSFLPSSFC